MVRVYEGMAAKHVRPNRDTFLALMEGFCKTRDLKEVERLYNLPAALLKVCMHRCLSCWGRRGLRPNSGQAKDTRVDAHAPTRTRPRTHAPTHPQTHTRTPTHTRARACTHGGTHARARALGIYIWCMGCRAAAPTRHGEGFHGLSTRSCAPPSTTPNYRWARSITLRHGPRHGGARDPATGVPWAAPGIVPQRDLVMDPPCT